jgi:hypothetical protein
MLILVVKRKGTFLEKLSSCIILVVLPSTQLLFTLVFLDT